MTDLVIIDTDILIDAGRGISEAVTCLQEVERQSFLAISSVTQMELIVGCQSKAELRTLERFLNRFQVIKLSEQISDLAIDLLRLYRLSHGLLIADSIIAATALSLGKPFVTKNQRDYKFRLLMCFKEARQTVNELATNKRIPRRAGAHSFIRWAFDDRAPWNPY